MDGKKVVIGLIIGLAIGLIAGGAVWLISGGSKNLGLGKPKPTATPTEALTTPTPEATPTPELNRSDLSLEVLNGSGAPGVAGDAQDYLQELGYENIEVGNAGSYDYDQTEVAIKESKQEYLQTLLNDLNEKYTVNPETTFLEEDYDYDAQIIIGTE
jgi:hypothetical protein